MQVHANDVVISQSNRIANSKSPPLQFDKTIPGRVLSISIQQQGLLRHLQKTKLTLGLQ